MRGCSLLSGSLRRDQLLRAVLPRPPQLRHYEWKGLQHYKLDMMPQPRTTNGRPLFKISRRPEP